jgi:chorismate mutase/prephenate dehydratase
VVPRRIETVAYPGREGAHTFQAALSLWPDEELRSVPSFRAVADAVALGEVDVGVLPMESSLVGPVAETHDLLFESPLSVIGQIVMPIEHCLAGPEMIPLSEIKMIHSHPVALDQCRDFLASLPEATAVAAATTATAAQEVSYRGDPTHTAIASPAAARLYGLQILQDGIGDHPEAFTRFVSVATYTRLDREGDNFRTALSFVTDHRAGALFHALGVFSAFDIDLVQLVSRPIPHTPFRHRFDVVLRGHPLDDNVNRALSALRLQARKVIVFGSYPVDAGDVVETGGVVPA